MIDVKKMRAGVDSDMNDMTHDERVMVWPMAERVKRCLDELEASRKQVAPCRFDVAAARTELARIDKGWGNGDVDASDSFRAARALLDRALAAIDAGWPAVDIESAALTVLSCTRGEEWTHWPTGILIGEQEQCRKIARAVLAYAGRRVEPAESAPVAITDAVVEEAAVRAYCARTGDGSVNAREDWLEDHEDERVDYRNEARAVLEYAASLGGVATFDPAELPAVNREIERLNESNRRFCALPTPTVDPRTERLTRYRCAFAASAIAGTSPDVIESRAHAMLAAEKEPARG